MESSEVLALVAEQRDRGLVCQTDVILIRTDHGQEWACVARFSGPGGPVEERVLRTFEDSDAASEYHYGLVRALNAPEAADRASSPTPG